MSLFLCVDDGDAGEVDDVLDLVAALEDVDGLVHPDEHRADGVGATEPLEQLVAGNIGYKLLQRLGGADAIGPMLVGMDKPVHVLQRGDEVKDIVNLAGVAVVDAQNRE